MYYDQVWLRRDGKVTVAVGPNLLLKWHLISNWKKDAFETVDVVGDWWFIHYQPKPNDVIIDVGAGMGEDSLLFARKVGPDGMVFAFEAHPATFACLSAVCRVNHLNNVTIENLAAFSSNTTITIEDGGDDDAWHENSVMISSSAAGNQVQAIRIDDYEPLHAYHSIDFLKMNIEGAEVDALLGMSATLCKIKHVCIACHDFLAPISGSQMITRERCKQILLDSGFDVYEVVDAVEPWQKDHIHGVRRL